jgi:hypothetical protein
VEGKREEQGRRKKKGMSRGAEKEMTGEQQQEQD